MPRLIKPRPVEHSQRWHAERAKGVGASEAATILGLNPYESPWHLWGAKAGILDAPEQADAMEVGSRVERVILEMFVSSSGVDCYPGPSKALWHPSVPLFAHPDAIVSEGKAPIEAKNPGGHIKLDQPGQEGGPTLLDAYRVQVHAQMMCEPAAPDHGYLAVLHGKRFFYEQVERDEALCDAIAEAVPRFWQLVVDKTPPEIDASEDCRTVQELLYGAEAALGDERELPGDIALSAQRAYHEACAAIKTGEALKKLAYNELLELVGDARVGTVGGVKVVGRSFVPGYTRPASEIKDSWRLNVAKPQED